jgi:asparagine synthase (glutamine-hydrolysing)
MMFFTCLTDPACCGISDSARREYESLPRTRGLAFEWRSFGHAAVLTAWDGGGGNGVITIDGAHLAVGTVRLDNPRDLEQWAGVVGAGLSDLELVLHTIAQCGVESVRRILGDFAFVYWDTATRTGVAACDALSVRKLYYGERHGLVAFSSRAEALAQGDRYNVRFLAEQVAACDPTPEISAYEGVATVPAGTMLLLDRRGIAKRRYWSPEDIDPSQTPSMQEQEASETLRTLLIEAVRSRLGRPGETWAQLSGGVDSSSVVSITQWLVERGDLSDGLAGTITYVDRAGTTADERAYSQVIRDRWQVPNRTIVDPPLWYDQRHAPPRLDQPRQNFMFYPREYLLAETVQGEGGRVLLSGQGPDEYLRGSMYFFADWIAQGRVGAAVREMVRRAAIGRASFWELAYRNAVVPLMPPVLQRWFGPEVTRLQPWVEPAIVQKYGLRDQVFEMTLNGGRFGQKYRHTMARSLITLTKTIGHLVVDDLLDVRHPFLDRRLVEFGLRLPPELTTRPHAGKWLLREAMRGIVPEAVRTRVGKGSLNERHAWSLSAQRALLAPLVQEPILADLGVVDAGELRAAFDRAPQQAMRRAGPHSALQQILAVEAWLQLRAGRWPRGATNTVS